MTKFTAVARVEDIPENSGLAVKLDDVDIALFRVGNEVLAINNVCPHRMTPLAHGWAEGGKVFCPMHGWEFDLRTGACATNPAKPVRSFETRVVDGVIEVKVAAQQMRH